MANAEYGEQISRNLFNSRPNRQISRNLSKAVIGETDKFREICQALMMDYYKNNKFREICCISFSVIGYSFKSLLLFKYAVKQNVSNTNIVKKKIINGFKIILMVGSIIFRTTNFAKFVVSVEQISRNLHGRNGTDMEDRQISRNLSEVNIWSNKFREICRSVMEHLNNVAKLLYEEQISRNLFKHNNTRPTNFAKFVSYYRRTTNFAKFVVMEKTTYYQRTTNFAKFVKIQDWKKMTHHRNDKFREICCYSKLTYYTPPTNFAKFVRK